MAATSTAQHDDVNTCPLIDGGLDTGVGSTAGPGDVSLVAGSVILVAASPLYCYTMHSAQLVHIYTKNYKYLYIKRLMLSEKYQTVSSSNFSTKKSLKMTQN